MGSVELVWRKIGFTPLNALRTLFVLLYFFSVCFGTLICWLEGTCPDGEVEGCPYKYILGFVIREKQEVLTPGQEFEKPQES